MKKISCTVLVVLLLLCGLTACKKAEKSKTKQKNRYASSDLIGTWGTSNTVDGEQWGEVLEFCADGTVNITHFLVETGEQQTDTCHWQPTDGGFTVDFGDGEKATLAYKAGSDAILVYAPDGDSSSGIVYTRVTEDS